MPDLAESVRIDAPADLVYSMVSDLGRMGEWSPECTGVTWRGGRGRGGRGRGVGGRFVGHNRDGWKRWSTYGRIVRAVPSRVFAFDISLGPVRSATWAYVIETADDGCTVTEEWTDHRPAVIRAVTDLAFGARRRINRDSILTTLANVRAAAEARTG
ncbi:MAG TPA: SRPBCC family protein [Streptosporangiales bacterium]